MVFPTALPTGTPPVYVRAAHLARALGVSKRLLLADAEAGRVPLRIARFGASGIAHVRADEAAALLADAAAGTGRSGQL